MISTKLHKVDVNINYNETSSIISKLGTAGSNLSGVNGVGNCFSDKLSTFYSGLGDKTTEYISKIRSAISSLASLISSGINKYDKVDKDYYYQLLNILNNFEEKIDNFDINEARKFIKSISNEKLLKSHPDFSNNHGRVIQYSGHWQKDGYDIKEYEDPKNGKKIVVTTDSKGNEVKREYENDKLKKETRKDIDGKETVIEYDDNENPIKTTIKQNGKETIQDESGKKQKDSNVEDDGTKTTTTYYPNGKKKTERQVNPDGSIVETEYDESGNAHRYKYNSEEDERNKKEKIQQYKSEQERKKAEQERKKAEEEKREAKKRQEEAENMQKQREQEKRKKAEQEQSEKAQQERKKAEEEERKRGEEKNTDEES